MSPDVVFDWVVRIAVALGVPGILLWYFRSGRKDRAAGRVAWETQGAAIAVADSGALEAHVLAVERAFAVERASKDRRIRELEAEVRRIELKCDERVNDLEVLAGQLRTEIRDKDSVIDSLTDQVGTLTAAVERLQMGQGKP